MVSYIILLLNTFIISQHGGIVVESHANWMSSGPPSTIINGVWPSTQNVCPVLLYMHDVKLVSS